MTMQEMSCAVQYEAPIKIFILNNQYMGMVRQWQQLLHGNRLSHSYTEALPDFVKLAEAYGGHGIRCEKPGDLDAAIKEMISVKKPVIFDCRVARSRQLLPDDPLGQGAQRDAAARRSDRRGGGQCDRRQGPGIGVRKAGLKHRRRKWYSYCVLPWRNASGMTIKLSTKGQVVAAQGGYGMPMGGVKGTELSSHRSGQRDDSSAPSGSGPHVSPNIRGSFGRLIKYDRPFPISRGRHEAR